MRTTIGTSLGPQFTPPILKKLIIAVAACSLGIPILDAILESAFSFPGIAPFLTLNRLLLPWAPFTYFWIQQPDHVIDFGLLISLFFQMYVFWFTGTAVIERYGPKTLLTLFLGGGITAGALAYFLMLSTGAGTWIAGSTAAILSVFTFWTMMYPDAQLLLFFIIPVKTKWLLGGTLAAVTLVNLSSGSFIYCLFFLSGALFSYFYGVMRHDLRSPFPQTHSFDLRLAAIDLKKLFKKRRNPPPPPDTDSKIYDIHTGKPKNEDEEFLDRILDKISKKGKDSLTPEEKKRLDSISKKR